MAKNSYWLDKPGNVKKLLVGLYLVCGCLLLSDAIYHRHTILSMENWFGFYGIYGFVACVILVLVATQIRKLVSRPEHYYERKDDR